MEGFSLGGFGWRIGMRFFIDFFLKIEFIVKDDLENLCCYRDQVRGNLCKDVIVRLDAQDEWSEEICPLDRPSVAKVGFSEAPSLVESERRDFSR